MGYVMGKRELVRRIVAVITPVVLLVLWGCRADADELLITKDQSSERFYYNTRIQVKANIASPYWISHISAFRQQLISSSGLIINGESISRSALEAGNGTVVVGGQTFRVNGRVTANAALGFLVWTSPSSVLTYRLTLDPSIYVGQSFTIGGTTGTIAISPGTVLAEANNPSQVVIGSLSKRQLVFQGLNAVNVALRCGSGGELWLDFTGLQASMAFTIVPPQESIEVALSTDHYHNVYNAQDIGQMAVQAAFLNTSSETRSFTYDAEVKSFDGRRVFAQTGGGSPGAGSSVELTLHPDVVDTGFYKLVVNATDTLTGETFRKFLTIGVIEPVQHPAPVDWSGKFAVHFFTDNIQEAQLIRSVGPLWSREAIYWPTLNPSPGVFNWTEIESFVSNAETAGLRIMPISSGWMPDWAKTGAVITDKWGSFEDIDRNAWRTYWTEMVRLYRDRVGVWETFNEFCTNRIPIQVAVDLNQIAYQSIKAEDPDALVVANVMDGVYGFYVPGAGTPVDYLREFLQAGGGQYCDVVSMHPYTTGHTASPETGGMREQTIAAKGLIAQYAPNLQLWWTEYGWLGDDEYDSNIPAVQQDWTPYIISEHLQAQYVARAYLEGMASGAGRMFYFNDSDATLYPVPFALLRGEGIRPALCAVNAVYRALEYTDFVQEINPQADVRLMIFSGAGRCAAAVWSTSTPERKQVLEVSLNPSDVEVLSMTGDTLDFLQGVRSIGVPFDGSPAFIVSNTLSSQDLIQALENAKIHDPVQHVYVTDFVGDAVYRYYAEAGDPAPSSGSPGALFATGGGLDGPTGIAVGLDGNLYVAGYNGDNIVRFDATTGEFLGVFASDGGLDGPTGLTFGPDGNMYVCSSLTNNIKCYDGGTGVFVDSLASSGGLSTPSGLVFGPDRNLYVSSKDTNNVLRYDDATGSFLGVFASGGGLSSPAGLSFGRDGDLYVSSSGSGSVKRYNGVTGAYIDDPVAGGLGSPHDVVFGVNGSFFITDAQAKRVLRWGGSSLSLFAADDLEEPRYAAFLAPVTTELVVASLSTPHTIKRFDFPSGGYIGDYDSGSGWNSPAGIAFAPDGYAYVTNYGTNSVLRVDAVTGTYIDIFASTNMAGPMGLAFGPDDNLYVANTSNNSVTRYQGPLGLSPGAYIDTFVSSGSGGLSGARNLLFGSDWSLLVASANTHRIKHYDRLTGAFLGDFINTAASGLSAPRALALGPDGDLYVSSETQSKVFRYNGVTGAFIDQFIVSGSGGVSGSWDLAFGPDGNLYIGSYWTNSVKQYDGTTGAYIGEFAAVSRPVALAFFPSEEQAVPVFSIAEAKNVRNGHLVNISGAIVSAVFYGDYGQIGFATEKSDRSVGIRVISSTVVNLGDSVNISGTAAIVDGERVINASSVLVNSIGNPTPEPVGMTNLNSGGGANGLQGAVVDEAGSGSMSTRLNNVGLLMTIFGRVTARNDTDSYDGYFYVDDGSGLNDGSGHVGVKCRPAGSGGAAGPLPALNSYVIVTGMMGVRQIGGRNARYMWTKSVDIPASPGGV